MASVRSPTTTATAQQLNNNKPTLFTSADNIFGPHPLPLHQQQQQQLQSTSLGPNPDVSNQRRLSLPDLTKLKEEWAQQEALQGTILPPGKLQIDLLNVRSDVDIRHPRMRVRMGSQQYYSSRSKDANGNWNEGFLFTISYHNQLFDTIELDLYDRRKGWRSKTKHIGKAKLKISKLKNRHDVYLTFLPMYEYHTRRYLPAHIPLPHNFLKSHMPSLPSLPNMPNMPNIPNLPKFSQSTRGPQWEQDHYLQYPQHPSHRKNSMTPFIGSIQIRVRYVFQRPPDTIDHSVPVYLPYNAAKDFDSYSTSTLQSNGGLNRQDTLASSRHSQRSNRTVSTRTFTDDNGSPSSSSSSLDSYTVSSKTTQLHQLLHQEQQINVDCDFHDAIEPDVVHVTDIQQVQQQHLYVNDNNGNSRILRRIGSATSSVMSIKSTGTQRQDRSATATTTPIDDSFGFSQCDTDGRNLLLARVTRKETNTTDSDRKPNKKKTTIRDDRDSAISDTSSIRSHNFGDKNFAFRWINESFEEVALSHPSLDRMIGLVVSPQTRILVRAVVKMMNAFGQGFKVTSMQLFSSLSMLQKFYTDVPRAPPAGKVTDLRFLDEAHYFLGHAIIAYGWRGISYLGDYAKYLKDVMKTRSNKLAIVRFLKIPQEDLLGYEYGLRKGAVFQPSYFVSVDRGHEAVVLGIRGTWSLYDVITDLVCDYKPWKGGLVHSGMLASAQWFFTRIIPQIFHYIHERSKQQTAPFIKSFIITGHSLGAGTAAILTMMIADHLDELRQLSNNPDFKVHCYSYAPVASVSLDLSEKYKNHIDSFVCHDDLVARLSYGTASCTKELVMDALIAADGLGGINKVNNDETTRKACFDILKTRRDEIFQSNEPRYPLLYVPGKVYQFRRRSLPASTNQDNKKATRTKSPSTSSASASSSSIHSTPKSRNSSNDDLSANVTQRRHSTTSSPISQPSSRAPNSSNTSLPTSPLSSTLPSSQSEPLLSTGIEDVVFTLHQGSALLSEEMLISKTCLEDHMLVTYLKAFQTAREDCMRADGKKGKEQQQYGPMDSAATVPNIRVQDPDGKSSLV
ncbi:hypothetical protein BC941DRAFT_471054 [Chlamydoabsidia padenii]|nr:hypothetical protein BC941DRAFT_471054 [Chlamydoabsidia padenii]